MNNQDDLIQRVRYLRDVSKLTFRQIAEELGISRGKCLRRYAKIVNQVQTRPKKLDQCRKMIEDWYREHPSLKAIQIWHRLQERQINVSYPSVSTYTRALRQPRQRFYHSLSFEPGEEGQVDWFFWNHPKLGKLAGFVLVLSYSRYCYAHLFPRCSFEFFIEGHLKAFAEFGGHPRSLRYDNLKSVVLKRNPLTFNPGFLDFARHHSFEIRLCNVARGNEKGRVERSIRSIRDTFCNVSETHSSLDALNCELHEWCKKKNNTAHRSTEKVPAMELALEQLQAMPEFPWRNSMIYPPQRISKTALVTFDANQYSVPDYLVGHNASIHAFCDHLEIYNSNNSKIATHPRCFGRRQILVTPAHRSFARISEQAKRERILAVIRNLDPISRRFLELNAAAGHDPQASAHALFVLLRSHARSTILSALRYSVERKTPHIKFVYSLLVQPPEHKQEVVLPQRHSLLDISYKPRSLEEYD